MSEPNNLSFSELTGRSENHLQYSPLFDCLLQRQACASLKQLKDRAERELGIDLQVASGFRSYQRQLAIWQGKAGGRRPVMDLQGEQELDISCLSEVELCHSILRWSALPGASRHHWGSEVDVFDAAGLEPGYQLQLSPWEYSADGPFARLSGWLDAVLAEPACAWFRPYATDTGAVAAEPWHISYQPIASICAASFDQQVFEQNIRQADLALHQTLLDNVEDLYHRYIKGEP